MSGIILSRSFIESQFTYFRLRVMSQQNVSKMKESSDYVAVITPEADLGLLQHPRWSAL